MKAMTIFSHMVRSELQEYGTVAFEPIRVLTNTKNLNDEGFTEKDATVWRALLIKR
jgi:hypothetical protein